MSTSSASWFYQTPEHAPYPVAERVRNTFWDERIVDIWLDTLRPETPYLVAGRYQGVSVELEWEPGRWLRLSAPAAAAHLARAVGNMLRRRPSLRYETAAGMTAWEWWVEGADQRWQEIQGKPAFGQPVRLDRDQ